MSLLRGDWITKIGAILAVKGFSFIIKGSVKVTAHMACSTRAVKSVERRQGR